MSGQSRASRFLISTLKELTSNAEIVSHKLMLRAGMTRRLAAAIYTWKPVSLRVVRKKKGIIRNEMNQARASGYGIDRTFSPSSNWRTEFQGRVS